MSSSSNGRTHGNNIAGALMLGLLGSSALALAALVAGHGILMAFLVYSMAGTLLVPTVAVAPFALRKARARVSHLASLTHGLTHPA